MSKRDFSAINQFVTPVTREEENNTPVGDMAPVNKGEIAPPTDENIKAFLEANGYKLTPLENKTKRINVLLQPSVHDKVKAIAKKKKTSVNAIIEEAIKKYIEEA